MEFSPARVLALLLYEFGISKSVVSDATRKERKVANSFSLILRDAELGELDVTEEEDIEVSHEELEERDTDWIDEENEIRTFVFSTGTATEEQVQDALDHYRKAKKGYRTLSSMKTSKRIIGSENDLTKMREYERTGQMKTNRRASLRLLSELLYEDVASKFAAGVTLHDRNLRQMALRINKENNFLIPNFKACATWIGKFKKHYRIRSRRVTRFMARKNFVGRAVIDDSAKQFVEAVRQDMKNIPLHLICNADQSGFVKEMLTPRSLAPIGSKKVERTAMSMSALTHSYTIMPILYADGRLGAKLLIVFAEPKGVFPKCGHFQAENLVVLAGTSHIMTKKHMLEWLELCLVPSTPQNTYLIVDSWTSFKDHNAMKSVFPPGNQLTVMNIPPGTTSDIQPLDVYFFRPFKQMVKAFTSYVEVHNLQFIVHKRDNILKMVSLIYRQFSAPCFRPFLQYPWHAAGYTDHHPGPFQTPAEVCFPDELSGPCEETPCSDISFIKCAHCQNTFCFHHFVEAYHVC